MRPARLARMTGDPAKAERKAVSVFIERIFLRARESPAILGDFSSL